MLLDLLLFLTVLLCFLGNKLNYFPQVKSVLPTMVIAESSPCLYLDSQAFCYLFIISPVLLRGGGDRSIWWVAGS